MKERQQKCKLDGLIKFRVSKDEKKQFADKAKQMGISLSELALTRIRNMTVPNREYSQHLYAYISALTKEMNHIGSNINQVTIAIHQINKSQKIEMGDFNTFNILLKNYLMKRDELKETLDKILFP